MRNLDVTRSPRFERPLQGVPLTNELEIMSQTARILAKEICSYSCHMQPLLEIKVEKLMEDRVLPTTTKCGAPFSFPSP